MRAVYRLLLIPMLLGCTSDAQTPKAPVVVELFTSQGCSSCPPADKLLSKLRGEDPNVIALAYHVDYWNYIGWTDPFSSPRWSQRQREYARVMKSAQVYTPQAVINGKVQLVGSSEFAVRAEIDRQRAHAPRGQVVIDDVKRSADSVTVQVHSQNAQNANVIVTLFENGVSTDVKRGENANRHLVNDGIVRWQGIAKGSTVTIPLDKSWNEAKLGVAALLQDPQSLEIYGAAAEALK